MPVAHYTEVKLPEIHYKSMTKTRKGSNVVYIRARQGHESNLRIQLATPDEAKCRLPFGISQYDEDSGARPSVEISLENPELVKFFQALDEQNLNTAIANKDKWFKGAISEEKIRMMYYPLLTFDPQGKYPPRLHTKANIEAGDRQLRVVNVRENKTGPPTLSPGTHADVVKYADSMPIVEVQSLWFQKVQFGMTILVTDLAIFPKQPRKEAIDDFGWGSGPKPVVESETATRTTTTTTGGAIAVVERKQSPPKAATQGQAMSILLTGAGGGAKRKAGESTVTLVKEDKTNDKRQKK